MKRSRDFDSVDENDYTLWFDQYNFVEDFTKYISHTPNTLSRIAFFYMNDTYKYFCKESIVTKELLSIFHTEFADLENTPIVKTNAFKYKNRFMTEDVTPNLIYEAIHEFAALLRVFDQSFICDMVSKNHRNKPFIALFETILADLIVIPNWYVVLHNIPLDAKFNEYSTDDCINLDCVFMICVPIYLGSKGDDVFSAVFELCSKAPFALKLYRDSSDNTNENEFITKLRDDFIKHSRFMEGYLKWLRDIWGPSGHKYITELAIKQQNAQIRFS